MRKLLLTVLFLICATGVASCASPLPAPSKPVEVKPAQLPPPPADVMVKREPTFTQRLLNFLSDSPAKPTP